MNVAQFLLPKLFQTGRSKDVFSPFQTWNVSPVSVIRSYVNARESWDIKKKRKPESESDHEFALEWSKPDFKLDWEPYGEIALDGYQDGDEWWAGLSDKAEEQWDEQEVKR